MNYFANKYINVKRIKKKSAFIIKIKHLYILFGVGITLTQITLSECVPSTYLLCVRIVRRYQVLQCTIMHPHIW
jgi:hypothetical protein